MKKSFLILCALLLTAIGASAKVDYSYLINTGTWNSTAAYNNVAHELYQTTAYTSGQVLYQTITGLPAGTYEVTFYAVASSTGTRDNITNDAYGDNIAQAFANEAYKAVTVIQQTACTPSDYEYTLTCTVETDGKLVYGLQNVATGGNWYVCQGVSLYSTSETPTQRSFNEGDVVESESSSSADEFTHWIISGPSNGTFVRNDWSTEGETSGMVVPFFQYWIGSGSVLGAATLRHYQLGGLPTGLYTVTLDARAFDENSLTEISAGTIFIHANEASVDITTGTHNTFNNVSAEVYGTYTLVAEVKDEGTLDINITVAEKSACDWVSWKNLSVVYNGASLPDLDVVTGDMNASVKATMETAVDAYNSSKTDDNYAAALAAIAAAEESAAQYAEIAALVAALDTDGAAVWANTTSASLYNAKTLTTSDDISADMAAAQLAQTTANSDMTYVLTTTGEWSADQGNGPGTCPNLSTAMETYDGSSAFTAGDVLYKTITGLQPGTYTVTFYAVENSCNGVDTTMGDIAEAFANCSASTLTVGSVSNMGGSWSGYTAWSLTCTVGYDGTLTFGVRNTSAGGNWCVAEAVSLTLDELADIQIVQENIFLKNVYGGDLVSRGKQSGVAADVDFVGTPLTLYSYDDGKTVVIWYADADISSADTEHQSYLGGTNWASANNTLCDAVYFTMTETTYTDEDGNQATGYQFSSDNGLLYRYDAASTPETDPSSDNTYRLAVNGTNGTNFSNANQAIWVIVTTTERDEIKAAWVESQKVAVATAAGLTTITTADEFDAYVATMTETSVYSSTLATEAIVTTDWTTSGSPGYNADGYAYGVETYQGYSRLSTTINGLTEGIYKITLNGLDRNSDAPYSMEMYDKGYKDLSESYIYANGYEINLKTWASDAIDINSSTTGYYYPNWMDEASACFEEGKYLNELYTYVGEDGDLTIQIALLVTEYYGWAQVKNFSLYRLDETITWEMTSAEWGTLILPFAASVPTGLTAYSCAGLETDETTLTLKEESTLESCTPYILNGTEGTYTFAGVPENTKDKYQVGLLVGTLVGMSQASNDFTTDGTEYVLQNHTDGGGVAFYPITTESTNVTLSAYHCYLNTGTAVAALRLPDTATRIEAVEGTEVEANGAIYDLSGRKVSKAVKGVYIMNGKKVMVK